LVIKRLNFFTSPIKFTTFNVPQCPLSIGYNDKYREDTAQTKFLGLQIDNHLNWKNHIDQLIPKLSGACYAVSSCYISAILTRSNQFIWLFSLLNEVWNNFLV
jgi:hypothetical protein